MSYKHINYARWHIDEIVNLLLYFKDGQDKSRSAHEKFSQITQMITDMKFSKNLCLSVKSVRPYFPLIQ